jgi:uncharacterized protein YjbI with pentapeptide repeats
LCATLLGMADQDKSAESKEVPVVPAKKEGLFDRVLRLLNKVATISLSVVLVVLVLLVWSMWRMFGSGVDLPTVLLVCGTLAIALIVLLPKLQVRRIEFKSNAERFGAENEARKTVATLVGGVAIFVSFYTAQQQLGVQQQVQFTDRYTKAIDQIAASDNAGNPKLAVRVGGLYVLEQIMNSSEAQHASILEVLCAYIRDNSLQTALKPSNGPRADTRVALTILGRRNRDLEVSEESKKGWRLFKAFLRDREFLNTLTIEHVRPRLDFSGSDLARADLSHLVLAGADFSGVRLTNCRAYFADLSHVSFYQADLSDCVIGSTLDGADFRGANLEGAAISGKVSGALFQDANVGLSIWIGANLEHPRDIQAAKDWEKAFYSTQDLAALGLPPDNNIKLLRLLRSREPAASTENKIRLTLLLQKLQKLTGMAQNLREELLNPQSPKQPIK